MLSAEENGTRVRRRLAAAAMSLSLLALLLVAVPLTAGGDGNRPALGEREKTSDKPSLETSKTVDVGAAQPGNLVTYAIRLARRSNTHDQTAAVTDTLPLGFVFHSMVDGPEPETEGQQVRWTEIGLSTPVTLTFQVTVGVEEGTYSNTVEVRAGNEMTTTGPTAPVIVDGTPPTSTVDIPASGGVAEILERVQGRARDRGTAPSDIEQVLVSIEHLLPGDDREHWNGTGWQASRTWLTTTLEASSAGAVTWARSIPLSAWTPCESYRVRARATDRAGNEEAPAAENEFGYACHHSLLPMVRKDRPPDWHQAAGSAVQGKVIYSLAVCPLDPAIVYAGTRQNGILRSNDGGRQWQTTSLDGEMVWSIAVDPGDCQVAYATSWGRGVLKTMDGGAYWQEDNEGLDDWYLYALAISPQSPGPVLAGTANSGVYRRESTTSRWRATPLSGVLVDALAIDPADGPGAAYAGTWGDGIHMTLNGGSSWAKLDGYAGDNRVYALAIDPNDPKFLYAGTYQQGVYRSDNGGAGWAQDGLLAQAVYTVVIDKHGSAYAGTDGAAEGVSSAVYYRSEDGWGPMKTPLDGDLKARSLAFSGDILLAGTTDGVWWYGSE